MSLVSIFGYIAIVYFLSKVAALIWQLMRAPQELSSFGAWTVITGATDGIGKAMAVELARKGQNLLLIGRNKEKLKQAVSDIQQQSGMDVSVETLQVDLAEYASQQSVQQQYVQLIKDKDVGILINNAGMAYPYTNYFDQVAQSRIEQMMGVNNVAATILMHQTIQNKFVSKTKSAIVNISSAGAIVPHAFHVVYSATKAFLNKITVDLASEYASKGIAVQSQMPYFVATKMAKVKPSFTTPTAQQYAKAAVKQIGYSGCLSPYPVHACIFFLFEFIPNFILDKIIYTMHYAIKKKGDRKYQKKQ